MYVVRRMYVCMHRPCAVQVCGLFADRIRTVCGLGVDHVQNMCISYAAWIIRGSHVNRILQCADHVLTILGSCVDHMLIKCG